jgi:hypothetical protein
MVGVDGTGVSVGGAVVSVCDGVAGSVVGAAVGAEEDALQAAKLSNSTAEGNIKKCFMAFSLFIINKVVLGHEY